MSIPVSTLKIEFSKSRWNRGRAVSARRCRSTGRVRLVLAVLLGLIAVAVAAGVLLVADRRFVAWPMPSLTLDRLFDVGIVDANGDDRLDVFTTNHHFRQSLLIADGNGGYRDVVAPWGLDQSKDFPMAELSFTGPVMDRPGVYVFWLGTDLLIQGHEIEGAARWNGEIRVNDPVKVMRTEAVSAQVHDAGSLADETVIRFAATGNGSLRLRPDGQGLPITFQFDEAQRLDRIFVGRGKVSPKTRSFVLAMLDRHSMVWADYNGDGTLDFFTNRGALGGTLRARSEVNRRAFRDELFVSEGEGRFTEMAARLGIEKKGCSGRHARWVDLDRDGRLDLFVNCYERGNVEGSYPKQLWRQDESGRFRDIADEIGLGLPDQQIGGFAWLDAEGDGDVDLIAFQHEGLFLYRNMEGRFVKQVILPRIVDSAIKVGRTSDNEWEYDGKLSVADFDSDGDVDVFSASKRGNLLLRNDGDRFVVVDPVSLGLPPTSLVANWVDYDNDGLPDLHFVPQGLYRQEQPRRFERTGLLVLDAEQFDAAIVNWFDRDSDGRLDVLLALHEKHGFKHWWEFSETPRSVAIWDPQTFRNTGPSGHWLQVRVEGSRGNPQAIGAVVTVSTPSGRQSQEVGSTDGSFFSQGHYRLYYGLGAASRASEVSVRWPDGRTRTLKDVEGDRLLVVGPTPGS
jgi:hypothetical protein